MAIERYVRKDLLVSYTYKFTLRGRTYRGFLGHNLTLAEAKRRETVARGQAADGTHPPPVRQRPPVRNPPEPVPTFVTFAQRWIESYAVDARPRSLVTVLHRLNHHLLVYLADVRLDQATPTVMDSYRTLRRQEGAAARTINNELATLSALLHTAVAWGALPKSALSTIPYLRVEERPVRVLSADEEARLIMAATPHLRPLLRFAVHTGLRKTELLTLTWEAVDRTRREVSVVAHVAKNRHRRVVPLNRDALQALDDAHGRHGRVFGYHSIDGIMERAMRKAGLPGASLHVLRKTFATRLIEAGVDVDTVRQLLGHRSLAVTQRYVHSGTESARRAVDLLGGDGRQQRRLP